MTGAPLPPHERAWRHPSEVGRVVHEPPSARSHAIIVSTAAMGLLLVALLAVAVTPGGSPDEFASPGAVATDDADTGAAVTALASTPITPVNSTQPASSAVPGATAPPETIGERLTETTWALVTATSARSVTTLVTSTVAAASVLTSLEASVVDTVALLESTSPPAIASGGVAVPIEGGAMALMTQPARAVAPGEAVTAELPTGDTVTAVVMATDESGLVVVSLPTDAPGAYPVTPTAMATPAPDDTVHVHGADTVTMAALADLQVADGTPLTDADGNLVGLCVEDPASGSTTMMVIDRARVDAIGG